MFAKPDVLLLLAVPSFWALYICKIENESTVWSRMVLKASLLR